MKNYIRIGKNELDTNWSIMSETDVRLDTFSRAVNIHIKHKSILDAYLKDNDVGITYISYNEVGKYNRLCPDFINNYNEDQVYELKAPIVERLKECWNEAHPAQEYITVPGSDKVFIKPWFECGLLGVKDDLIIGWIKDKDGYTYASSWILSNGQYNNHKSTQYDLTPYEQPWYEIESNFPKHIITDDGYFYIAYGMTDAADEKHREFLDASHDRICGLEDCRLATNEEIDSLKVKEV